MTNPTSPISDGQIKLLNRHHAFFGEPRPNYHGKTQAQASVLIEVLEKRKFSELPAQENTIQSLYIARRMGGDDVTPRDVAETCRGNLDLEGRDMGIARHEQSLQDEKDGRLVIKPVSTNQFALLRKIHEDRPELSAKVGIDAALEDKSLNAVRATMLVDMTAREGVDIGRMLMEISKERRLEQARARGDDAPQHADMDSLPSF